jgi:hypothetical protein
MHNSAERDPPPRCHPTKRDKATQDIIDGIEDTINLTQAKLHRSLAFKENLEDPDGKIGLDQKDGNKPKMYVLIGCYIVAAGADDALGFAAALGVKT